MCMEEHCEECETPMASARLHLAVFERSTASRLIGLSTSRLKDRLYRPWPRGHQLQPRVALGLYGYPTTRLTEKAIHGTSVRSQSQ